MKKWMIKRTILISYRILETLGATVGLYLIYRMFGSLGVLIGAIVFYKIVKEVDKMM